MFQTQHNLEDGDTGVAVETMFEDQGNAIEAACQRHYAARPCGLVQEVWYEWRRILLSSIEVEYWTAFSVVPSVDPVSVLVLAVVGSIVMVDGDVYAERRII